MEDDQEEDYVERLEETLARITSNLDEEQEQSNTAAPVTRRQITGETCSGVAGIQIESLTLFMIYFRRKARVYKTNNFIVNIES